MNTVAGVRYAWHRSENHGLESREDRYEQGERTDSVRELPPHFAVRESTDPERYPEESITDRKQAGVLAAPLPPGPGGCAACPPELVEATELVAMASPESQSVRFVGAPAWNMLGFPNSIALVQPVSYWFLLFSASSAGCARRELLHQTP